MITRAGAAAVIGLLAVATGAAAQAPPPTSPGRAAFVQCATDYNAGRTGPALAECRAAIALDPTLADAYFVLASLLFADGQQVNGKFVAPAGTQAALNKYLELAPNGGHAGDVKMMLDYLK